MLHLPLQILPFLALGIGVDDMFLIAHAYAENANKPDIIYAVSCIRVSQSDYVRLSL